MRQPHCRQKGGQDMKTLGVAFDQFRLSDFIDETVVSKNDQMKDDSLVLQMGRDGKSSIALEGVAEYPVLRQQLQDGNGLFFHFCGPYGFLLQKSGDTLFINSAFHTGEGIPVPPAYIEIAEYCEAFEEPMRAYLDRFLM